MPDDPPNHFRFLDSNEFEVLPTEEKVAYLERAVIEVHKMHHPDKAAQSDRED